MLRFFTSRSGNTMKSVWIGRLIETKEELEAIFELVILSSSTIRLLVVCQYGATLNAQSRRFARSLPSLSILYTRGKVAAVDRSSLNLFHRVSNARQQLIYFATEDFLEVEENEWGWLSHLQYLQIRNRFSLKSLYSSINSCRSTLRLVLVDFSALMEPSTADLSRVDPIVLDELLSLMLPSPPLHHPSLLIPLITPKLEQLYCRLSQVEGLKPVFLNDFAIILEDEDGDLWNEQVANDFSPKFAKVMSSNPSIRQLKILVHAYYSEEFQTKAIFEALSLGSDQEAESVLAPNLLELDLTNASMSEMELEAVARMSLSRPRPLRVKLPDELGQQFEETLERLKREKAVEGDEDGEGEENQKERERETEVSRRA